MERLKSKLDNGLRRIPKRRRHDHSIRAELPLASRLLLIGVDLLLAGLLALSLGGQVFSLLGLDYDLMTAIPSLLIALPLIALLSWGRWNLLATLGLGLLTVLFNLTELGRIELFFIERINRAAILLEPVGYRYLYSELGDAAYQDLLASSMPQTVFLFLFLIALLAYLLAARFRMPFFSLITLASLVVANTYFTRSAANIWSLWGLATIVPLFFLNAASGTNIMPSKAVVQYLKVTVSGLLVSSILLAPAWLLAQRYAPNSIYSRGAQGLVDDLSAILPDAIRPQRRFDPFSLNQSGYYPHEGMLGGTAILNPNPVFHLRGQASGNLRGQTSETYTGSSWIRSSGSDTWRYGSALFNRQSEAVFGYDDRYLRELGIQSMRPVAADYEIRMLQNGITVLFTNGTIERFDFDSNSRMLAFFNTEGVLYAQYPLTAGQGYEIAGGSYDPYQLQSRILYLYERDPAGFNLRFGPDASGNFAVPEDDFSRYLQLPDDETHRAGGIVYETAHRIAGGSDEDSLPQDKLSQLLRLVDYHRAMHYSLLMPDPPSDQDFVEHVIDVQSGYCVYFATSLTVMARTLGIPSRYVEGFGIPGGAERTMETTGLTVTGEQAHAWTEVYLDGFGWIALDPTPGGVAGGSGDVDDNDSTGGEAPMPIITMGPEDEAFPDQSMPNGDLAQPDTNAGRGTLNRTLPYLGIFLLVLLLFVSILGIKKHWPLRLLLTRPGLAIRSIAKGRRNKDEARGSEGWILADQAATRKLVLLYWQEIRLTYLAFDRAQERALRIAAYKERRRIKKYGEDYKEPDRDFYKVRVQHAYKPSAFVEFLNEEVARREALAREEAQRRTLYENKPKQSKSILDRWSDPALVGTWRRELDALYSSHPLLKREVASALIDKSLAELLTEAERLAETAAFAHPDTRIDAESIYRLHFLYRRLVYLKGHWPVARN